MLQLWSEESPNNLVVVEKKKRDPEPSRGRLEQTLKKDEFKPEEEEENEVAPEEKKVGWRGVKGGGCRGPAH